MIRDMGPRSEEGDLAEAISYAVNCCSEVLAVMAHISRYVDVDAYRQITVGNTRKLVAELRVACAATDGSISLSLRSIRR